MTCYSLFSRIACFSVFGFPCVADEVAIGAFDLTVDAQAITLQSYYFAEDDFSDLTFDDSFGIKTYHVSASSDEGLPLLDVTLQEGSVIGDLQVVGVTFIDQDYDTALAATVLEAGGVAIEGLGLIADEAVQLDADGTISFSFSADLIRINLDTETPIAGDDGARIKARFAGQFPASELNE